MQVGLGLPGFGETDTVHWSGLAEAARHGEALRALLLALDGRR